MGAFFCGDVVLDTYNEASRYEDNILDYIYNNKYVRIILRKILILNNIIQKCTLKQR